MTSHPVLRSALAALLLAAGVAGCGGAPRTAEAPPVTGDRLVVAETDVEAVKPVSAVITSRDLAEARARIPGTLVRLEVREGDLVRQGDLIGVVVDDRIGLQTAALDAQAAAAEAEAARARADLSRVQTLYERGYYAQAALDRAQAAARAADAQARAVRAQRAASAETGSQGRILAPAAGRILAADVPQGSVVIAGQSVATVTAGPLVLRLELPEAQGRGLRVGQRVAVDGEGLPAEGVVTQVYPAAVAGRTIADVSAEGLPSDRVGQRVPVRVPIGVRQALILPERFVTRRYGIDFVRTVDRAGRVAEAPVQLGETVGGDRVEVMSGLKAGDIVLAPEKSR